MRILNQTERLISAKGRGHPAQFLEEEIAELREALDEVGRKTCQHCKDWHQMDEPEGVCTGGALDMSSDEFYPPADFGCNKWEAKECADSSGKSSTG